VHRGKVLGLVPKEKLPTYNVFYEGRTFSRGGPGLDLDASGIPLGDYLFQFDFGDVAVEVCEDAWSPDGPMRRRCYSGAEIVVNVSSSPYRMGIDSTRREMLATRAADNQAVLIYANAVGGQDGLIYDGGGYVFQNGRLVLDAPRFVDGWWSAVVDLDRTRRLRMENTTWRSDCEAFRLQRETVPRVAVSEATSNRSALTYPAPEGGSFFLPASHVPARDPRDCALDDLFEALAIGVKSYYEKTGAFRSIGIALSGGRDSMLTLLVAWRAAQIINGGAVIAAFYMPSRHSQDGTKNAAHVLAAELGVSLTTVSIDEATDREVAATREMLGGQPLTENTRQNVQARLRGQRMWNWANSSGALFLQTGDMSEKAVGYTTIGGDLEGALSVIANVPKTVVIARSPCSMLVCSSTREKRCRRTKSRPSSSRCSAMCRRIVSTSGRRASRSCSHSRFTSGCSRPCRCTSAHSIWIVSAHCRCRSCRRMSGKTGSQSKIRDQRSGVTKQDRRLNFLLLTS
jgi:NAD+ synthase (glutamine-hydrolysing)